MQNKVEFFKLIVFLKNSHPIGKRKESISLPTYMPQEHLILH